MDVTAEEKGAVALANIFCWAVALLYAKMGAKSVVISPPSLSAPGGARF